MASSSASFLRTLFAVTMLLSVQAAMAQTVPNVTEILVEAQEYTTLVRLLEVTQLVNPLQELLNSSVDGVTLFAPTDTAFANLPQGAHENLTEQAVSLLLFHAIPKFYTFETITDASNPIQTVGSNGTAYTFNVTASSDRDQFSVSTGVNTVTVNTSVYVTSPLAIYSVDQVLLPTELFGNTSPTPMTPTPAPPPTPTPMPAPAPMPMPTPTPGSEVSVSFRMSVPVENEALLVSVKVETLKKNGTHRKVEKTFDFNVKL